MITQEFTIDAPRGPMRVHLARLDDKPRPAVIVLEGIYGFDDEIKRITDVTAAGGFDAIAVEPQSSLRDVLAANIGADRVSVDT